MFVKLSNVVHLETLTLKVTFTSKVLALQNLASADAQTPIKSHIYIYMYICIYIYICICISCTTGVSSTSSLQLQVSMETPKHRARDVSGDARRTLLDLRGLNTLAQKRLMLHIE